MLKFIKFSFGFIIIVLMTLLVIPFFVNVNDYKPEIKQAVDDATGRNIEIGNIKLSLFPWIGITLTHIQFANAPGFKHENMLEVASVDIQVALMPLFDQQIKVTRFELNAPKIWMTQRADGRNNWSDLSLEKTTGGNTPQNKTTNTRSIAFEAKLIHLQNGQVIWQDANKGDVVINDIQLNITDLQLKQPIGIDLSAKIEGNPIRINAEIGPVWDINKFDIAALPALISITSKNFNLKPFTAWLPTLEPKQQAILGQLANINLDIDVSIEQHNDKVLLSSGSLRVDAQHELVVSWKANVQSMRTLKVESFKLGIDKTDVLTMSAKIKGLDKQPHFEGKIMTGSLQRIWLNQFTPALQEIYKEHPEPWESIKLEAFLAGDADIVEIRNLQLTLNDEPIQMSGDIFIGDAPDIQLRITAGDLHLDPWIPQSKQPNTSGEEKKTLTSGQAIPKKVEPDLTFLKPWYLSIQLQSDIIHTMGLKLENLRMTLSSENGVVRLNPLSFAINGGRISENMTLYANRYPATWKESLRMKGVSIQPMLKALVDFDQLSGIATINTNMSGVGLLSSNIVNSAKGRGDFLFENGQLKGVDIAKEVRNFEKSPTESKQSDFAKVLGTFYIKDGVFTNNDLYLASPLFRLSGKGKLYLTPSRMDYRVLPSLVNTLQGQGGSIHKKGIVTPLHIFGSWDDIQVEKELDHDDNLDRRAAFDEMTAQPIGDADSQTLNQDSMKIHDEEISKEEKKLNDMFKGFNF
ncbi:MAG: AsmA family protein [Ghiorsea sp.]|nr:AsmA family protein [Ghiorsea sp.]